jgi:FkbM family methyltransferase
MLLNFDNLYKKYNMNVTGVIHIGAHRGDEYNIYIKYPSISSIIFFEPDPDNFNILKEKVGHDPKVICINKGLGPFSCKMKLNRETANSGQSNSVLEPHLHKRQYPGIIFNNSVEVNIEPLDKFEPSPILNMINIDVQGFELEVFRGSKKTLNNIKYIIAEVNKAELYKNCCLVNEVDEFLGKYNFKRVEETWDGITWGDAFYVKS